MDFFVCLLVFNKLKIKLKKEKRQNYNKYETKNRKAGANKEITKWHVMTSLRCNHRRYIQKKESKSECVSKERFSFKLQATVHEQKLFWLNKYMLKSTSFFITWGNRIRAVQRSFFTRVFLGAKRPTVLISYYYFNF